MVLRKPAAQGSAPKAKASQLKTAAKAAAKSRHFKVKSFLHLGLNLKIGKTYCEEELIAKCGHDASKLNALKHLFGDPAKLPEVAPDGKHHATGPSSKSKAPDESKSKKEVEADRPVSILKRPSARREEPSIEKPSIEKSSMEKRYVVRGSVGLGQSARIGEIMKKEELMSLCKTKQKKDKLEAHFKDPLRLQEVYVAIG
ncbi:unnamed protein product [Effrenium voratum]|nr:unnamed protein product [Effrenium voratum]